MKDADLQHNKNWPAGKYENMEAVGHHSAGFEGLLYGNNAWIWEPELAYIYRYHTKTYTKRQRYSCS
ncbi:hypothetical protein P029_00850 [Anaplasma phagocytophilum str. Norway variant2]|uniref:Uncharacterized protein n=1 Tax=Anaplasma phagocytophilum str. Norway variant2 TaxID=1392507 RepID=A0A161IN26_ANAPH|nr:hypothetical protein P029_00850 [Anaplasma phagocytophilum str. Norway variant2]